MRRCFLALCVLVICSAVQLPSNFKKCKRFKPDFKQCVLEAARFVTPQLTKPYKEINLPSLDPLDVSQITINLGTPSVNLNQDLRDCKVCGFSKFQHERFEINLEDLVIDSKGVFPELVVKCHYTIDGKVLLFPITGEGTSTVTLTNVTSTARVTYELVKRNKKTYAHIKTCTVKGDPQLLHINVENLFNGNKQLGDNMNKVFNENWRELWAEVKDDYFDVITRVFRHILEGFFQKVSLEDTYDDYN